MSAVMTDVAHDDATDCPSGACTPNQIHVMLDLETMGIRPDAAIVAIGAVAFGLTPAGGMWIGPSFYRVVDLASATADGGVMDAETVKWWLRQSEVARTALLDPHAVPLRDALDQFDLYMERVGECPRVWGNGAGFDNVILRTAYERAGMAVPWSHWDDRCYRTTKAEYHGDVVAPARVGTHHNALDDAMHQARHLMMMWQAMAQKGARA